jgi:hypothetical protein
MSISWSLGQVLQLRIQSVFPTKGEPALFGRLGDTSCAQKIKNTTSGVELLSEIFSNALPHIKIFLAPERP